MLLRAVELRRQNRRLLLHGTPLVIKARFPGDSVNDQASGLPVAEAHYPSRQGRCQGRLRKIRVQVSTALSRL